MTDTYKNYFNSQAQLKTATSLIGRKNYESATIFLLRARESATHVFNEPALAGNAVQNYTTCSILLIAIQIRRHRQRQAYEFQQESVAQLRQWQNNAATQALNELCRYCYQLLIAGCQHSRCLGHYMKQLEETGYAQEQT
ncbi:hypothetical protein DFO83_103349 [Idiomarina loihiensis]|uniref:hypothetical protein n=1 Tax=Idiomarina TaxID=135575 RepID=UPI000D7141A8|nr:hypothetical protein [Idiomarina]PWW39439.1 hypothetical protein DFO83_103349 [Idiomarina loihiensis]TDP49466.1 hypothetical protein DET58_10350 [Idiomarina loihiensis]TDS24220.1 hypothetical protein DET62_103349 [Idiomarina sp. H2]